MSTPERVASIEHVVCPACGESGAPEDRWCEACGAALGDERPDDGRVEIGAPGATGVSHRGLRHGRNEDAMHVTTLDGATVAIVCDGVSASSHPHVASRVAADAAGAVIAAGSDDVEARMRRAVAGAQWAVARLPWSDRSPLGPPACTFVGAVWEGTQIVVANVGDSRAYWIGADSSAECLTEDDSAARELELLGASPAEIERSGNLHAIVRWLGADAPADPYRVRIFSPSVAGRMILCSDGLWNYADEPAALAALVRDAEASAADVAHTLVDHALANGGEDNVTVVVVDCTPAPEVGDSATTGATPEEPS